MEKCIYASNSLGNNGWVHKRLVFCHHLFSFQRDSGGKVWWHKFQHFISKDCKTEHFCDYLLIPSCCSTRKQDFRVLEVSVFLSISILLFIYVILTCTQCTKAYSSVKCELQYLAPLTWEYYYEGLLSNKMQISSNQIVLFADMFFCSKESMQEQINGKVVWCNVVHWCNYMIRRKQCIAV